MEKKPKKVLVAMSGGVDSSVAAAILKSQGYDVSGVFLRLWKSQKQKEDKNLKDARRVAKILRIPLKVIDARKEFKGKVVKYFLDEYGSGKTPNPCVYCNKNLKFKGLFSEMKRQKVDFVATGHYAQIISKDNSHHLFEAKDKNKDQSYFLYTLNQEGLSRIIFPLGELTKIEARKMAKKFSLPVFDKIESQDICFLSGTTPDNFLKKNIKLKKGKIINESGEILGEHRGLPLYTLGQRKGINLGGDGPYYVTAKDNRNNILRVTNCPESPKLYANKLILKKINLISKKEKIPKKILIKTRYQQRAVSAIIKKRKNQTEVILSQPQRAVTPGQMAVFYTSKGEVLGGGVIN